MDQILTLMEWKAVTTERNLEHSAWQKYGRCWEEGENLGPTEYGIRNDLDQRTDMTGMKSKKLWWGGGGLSGPFESRS